MCSLRQYQRQKVMASDENNMATSPATSALLPLELLLKDVFASASKNSWKTIMPLHNKIQQIKQQIIKFHRCKKYADPTRIWELEEDSYLIRLENIYPTIYVTKCTLQHAIHLDISQIPLVPYVTSFMSDLDKETLRINNVFARFPEVSPFIFEVQIDVTATHISSRRAYISQQEISILTKFC